MMESHAPLTRDRDLTSLTTLEAMEEMEKERTEEAVTARQMACRSLRGKLEAAVLCRGE